MTRRGRRAESDPPHPLPSVGVVLVAAGSGRRLGADRPKSFVELGGRSLLAHGVTRITGLPHAGHLVVVVPPAHAREALRAVADLVPGDSVWHVSVVAGGRTRHDSVRLGVAALSASIETVLVHDAARPLTPTDVFERVLAEVRRTSAAVIPVLPVADTLKRLDDAGVVQETVDRDPLAAVQTPQGFPRELLTAAHDSALPGAARSEEPAPTDDAEVVQRIGGTVVTVPGDIRAHKVTTAADLRLLAAVLHLQEQPAGASEPASR